MSDTSIPANHSQQVVTRTGLSLFVILAGSFLAPLLIHSSTLAIPTVAEDLKLNAEVISWFTLMQVLGSVCLVLPAGKLSDIYGRKRIFAIGTLISGLACMLAGSAQCASMLLISRCMQGIGGAFIFAAALALVSSIPPPEQKARVMGVYIAVAYLGIVVGPLFGGVMLHYINWRWVFYLPGLMLLLIGLLGVFALKWEQYGDRNARLRILDTSLYMASLGLIALSVFKTQSLQGQFLLLTGLLAFAGFCWFQTRRRDPLLQVSLFVNNPVFTILVVTHFLAYAALLALPFTLTLYLQYVQSIDAQTTGLILISQAAFTAVVAPASGWLAARFRVRTLLIAGSMILFIGALFFTQLDANSSVWVVLAGLSLVGLAVGVSDTQVINTALSTVDPQKLGSASATLNGLRTMGGFVGVGVVSFLMSHYLGAREIVPALYPQLLKMLQAYFYIGACLIFMAFSFLLLGIWYRSRRRSS